MTQQIINTGTADKGNGDPIRTAFTKVNENFTELFNHVSAGVVSGDTAPTAPGEGDLWWDSVSGRLYVYYGAAWVDASPVDGAGIDSTNELVNGNKTVSLASTGIITLPSSSYLESTDTNLKVGAQGTVTIRSNAESNLTTKAWTFGAEGKLTLPAGTTYEYLSVPLTGHGDGLAVLDFALVTDGVSAQWIASSPNPEGVGYSVGDTFTFDETFLGIPGASTTIEVLTIGPGGSIVEIGFSQPPLYPSDIYRDSPINLQVGTESNRWTFRTSGYFSLPGGTANIISEQDTVVIEANGYPGGTNLTLNNLGVQLVSEQEINLLSAGGAGGTWTFDTRGTLTVPSPFPTTFTATVDSAHYYGEGSLTLSGDAWYFAVTFAIGADGVIETQITNNTPWISNPGYTNDIQFRFVEADHGIPGYTFTLTLVDIQNPGPMMYTTNLAASFPPTLPATITSSETVKLTADATSWLFTPNGTLTTPGDIQLGADSYLRFSDSSFQGTAFVGDATRLYGNVDEDVEVTVRHRTVVSAEAGLGTSANFWFDVTNNDDITVVQPGWELISVTGTGPGAITTTFDPPYIVSISEYGLSGSWEITVVDSDNNQWYGMAPGPTYAFRNPDATLQTWTFNQQTGTLRAPGGALLSSETADLGSGLTYRDFSIEVLNQAGDNEARWLFDNSGDLTAPDGGAVYATNLNTSYLNYQTNSSIQVGQQGGGRFIAAMDRFQVLATPPTSSVGSDGDVVGCVAFDDMYIYYCSGLYNGTTNIWHRVAWSGDTW